MDILLFFVKKIISDECENDMKIAVLKNFTIVVLKPMIPKLEEKPSQNVHDKGRYFLVCSRG